MANGHQTNILTKSYSGIQVCSLRSIEENLVDVGKSRHKKMCRDQTCVAATGAFGQTVPTFGCRGDMSPTCRQLYQPICLGLSFGGIPSTMWRIPHLQGSAIWRRFVRSGG
jgi:hypothetical protein